VSSRSSVLRDSLSAKRPANHVLLEERELFPLIEETIPEPELQALGESFRAMAPQSQHASLPAQLRVPGS
jgi:hypothetical protein